MALTVLRVTPTTESVGRNFNNKESLVADIIDLRNFYQKYVHFCGANRRTRLVKRPAAHASPGISAGRTAVHPKPRALARWQQCR
jgi:hypothetical protein